MNEKPLKMYIDRKYISIQVKPNYEYDALLSGKIGEKDALPVSDFSLYSWVNHLREKVWWNEATEKEFIRLGLQISKK